MFQRAILWTDDSMAMVSLLSSVIAIFSMEDTKQEAFKKAMY
jgi:hypothetical protein